MLKYLCNKCGKELSSRYFQCEIKTLETKDILLPIKGKETTAAQQRTQRIFHLCQNCFSNLEKEFKIKD